MPVSQPSVSDLALPSSPSGDGGDGGAVLLVPFDPEAAYSLLRRMQRLAALPAVVAPMLTFPEVIVIIIVKKFCCSRCFSCLNEIISPALWLRMFRY